MVADAPNAVAALARQAARQAEVIEALVDCVGAKQVAARIEERRKERMTRDIVANENDWKEKVAAGDAHPVKKVTKTSYIFARGPGDKPVCGPVSSVADKERQQLVRRGRVGATCKINGEPTVILAAYEDGPAPGKAAGP